MASLLFDKSFIAVKDTTRPAFIGRNATNGKVMSNDGDAPLPPPSPGPDPIRHPPDPSIAVDPQEQAFQRLITRAVPHDELPSLIETIFSGRKSNMVDRLSGSDAQAFIDVMDEVRHRAHYFRGMFDLPSSTLFRH